MSIKLDSIEQNKPLETVIQTDLENAKVNPIVFGIYDKILKRPLGFVKKPLIAGVATLVASNVFWAASDNVFATKPPELTNIDIIKHNQEIAKLDLQSQQDSKTSNDYTNWKIMRLKGSSNIKPIQNYENANVNPPEDKVEEDKNSVPSPKPEQVNLIERTGYTFDIDNGKLRLRFKDQLKVRESYGFVNNPEYKAETVTMESTKIDPKTGKPIKILKRVKRMVPNYDSVDAAGNKLGGAKQDPKYVNSGEPAFNSINVDIVNMCNLQKDPKSIRNYEKVSPRVIQPGLFDPSLLNPSINGVLTKGDLEAKLNISNNYIECKPSQNGKTEGLKSIKGAIELCLFIFTLAFIKNLAITSSKNDQYFDEGSDETSTNIDKINNINRRRNR